MRSTRDQDSADTKLSDQFAALSLSVTESCNIVCRHCYNNSSPKNSFRILPWHYFYALVDRFFQTTMDCQASDICITGGEPLLRSGTLKFLDYICSHPNRKKESMVTLQTNGTLITPSVARILRNLPVHIWISVDGPDDQIHDQLRGKGSFALVCGGMQNLKQVRASFGVAMFPTLFNIKHVKPTYDLVTQYGCTHFAVLDVLNVGRVSNNQEHFSIGILDLYEEMHKFYQNYPDLYPMIASPLSKDLRTLHEGKTITCGVGKNFTLHVFADGFTVPCYAMGRDSFGLGCITDRSFDLATITIAGMVQTIRNYVTETLLSRCSQCEIFGICGGGCPAETMISASTYVMAGDSCKNQIKRINYLQNVLQNHPLYQ